jgi:peptide/nickel transport system substrate-binding protein
MHIASFLPASLVASLTSLLTAFFLTAAIPAAAQQGGTLRLLAHAAAGTIDPQINYTGQFWQIFTITYDGLLAFRKVSGDGGNTVVPDLADALPTISDDGRTYRFHLRPDIHFSTGEPVTAADVAASFRRIFKVSSPTSGSFYGGIVGADQCLHTPATCTLEGGLETDAAAGTVIFHLTAPDSEFAMKLALPHAVILPSSTAPKDAGVTPIPTTGPYIIDSYDPNKRLHLIRNSQFHPWSADAQPAGFPDEINEDFGLEDEAEVSAVENNQADGMFDAPPSDRLAEIGGKYAKQVHLATELAMSYLPMNVNIPPFNSEKARQAVAFAIDRRAIVNMMGGPRLALPACQILPPGMQGYVPYCPFTQNPGATWTAPDLDRAKALVQESGTAGQKVTLITGDGSVSRNVGTYLQSVLAQLGYDAHIKAISNNIEFTYIQNTANQVQISLSSWAQDYPAPSDFLNVLFSCGSFRQNSDSSVNISGFCDPAIDARMREAMAETDPAKAASAWAAVDREITDRAPAAVLATPRHLDLISTRVKNYVYSDQFRWLLSLAQVQ